MANQGSDRVKAKVRYWWVIYRVLVTNRALRLSLRVESLWNESTWNDTLKLYQSWGAVEAISYDEWWNAHHTLFLDESSNVREITISDFKRSPDCLYLELNLNSRGDDLIAEVRNLLRTKKIPLQGGKNKKQKNTIRGFTQGAEIRPKVYEAYILFLKEIYAPCCTAWDIDWRGPRPSELRKFAQKQLQVNMQRFPFLHLDSCNDGKAIAYVSIKRYQDKVRQLCRAVARKEFPGAA